MGQHNGEAQGGDYLTLGAKKDVAAMLVAETAPLTTQDNAGRPRGADRYRDGNHRKDRDDATKRWHPVDLPAQETGYSV